MLQFTCLSLVTIDTKEKVEAYKPSVCVHNLKVVNDKVSKQKSAQFGLQLLTAWWLLRQVILIRDGNSIKYWDFNFGLYFSLCDSF